ncbi:MAG: hypothetical protein LDL33_09660, partial [Desulfomonile sp.]|nr:hypothetical protein [Desulfomonile sp.]
LELPEEALIGGEEAPLLYGSPIVDRIIGMATNDVPVVYARAVIQYLKQSGFETLLTQDLQFAGLRAAVSGRAETVAGYLILVSHYVARSDERKEGLVPVAVSEGTSAHVAGLETLWRNFQIEPYSNAHIPPQFAVSPEKALNCALQVAKEMSALELREFIDGMRRRLHRDIRSTREYYGALMHEMQAALVRPNLTDRVREERLLKMASLPEELDAKIRDLEHKYSIRVEVTGRAALRLLVPVVQLTVRLSYRKLKRSLSLIWNPLTQRIDPFVCEKCGKTIRHVCPREGKTGLLVVCKSCHDCA